MINKHLASCYSWGTTSWNISNSALRQGGASLWRYIWGWRVSVSPNIYVPLDRGMSVLQLCRWKFSLKKLCSRLHSIEVDIYSKKGKVRFLNHPLGDLEVTRTCTSSIARWKARVRLPIRHNWTFSLVLTVETLHAEICRRERFLKGVGHFDRPLKAEGDVAHQPLLGGRKLEGLPSCGIKISPVGSLY